MSRHERDNEKFRFVFGVDRTTSSYIQVWEQPADDQDYAILVVDNQGVHKHGEIPTEIAALTINTEKRFQIAEKMGNYHPNLDERTAIEFAMRLGFKDLGHTIYRVWDEEP